MIISECAETIKQEQEQVHWEIRQGTVARELDETGRRVGTGTRVENWIKHGDDNICTGTEMIEREQDLIIQDRNTTYERNSNRMMINVQNRDAGAGT